MTSVHENVAHPCCRHRYGTAADPAEVNPWYGEKREIHVCTVWSPLCRKEIGFEDVMQQRSESSILSFSILAEAVKG